MTYVTMLPTPCVSNNQDPPSSHIRTCHVGGTVERDSLGLVMSGDSRAEMKTRYPTSGPQTFLPLSFSPTLMGSKSHPTATLPWWLLYGLDLQASFQGHQQPLTFLFSLSHSISCSGAD